MLKGQRHEDRSGSTNEYPRTRLPPRWTACDTSPMRPKLPPPYTRSMPLDTCCMQAPKKKSKMLTAFGKQHRKTKILGHCTVLVDNSSKTFDNRAGCLGSQSHCSLPAANVPPARTRTHLHLSERADRVHFDRGHVQIATFFNPMNSTIFVLFGKYCPIVDQLGSKDSSRDFQLNCVISYFFYLHLILHASG